MEVLGIVLKPILRFLFTAVEIYKYILIVRAILSFFVQDYFSNPLVNFIYRITEPPLAFFRERLPFLRVGMFDFSIIALFLLIEVFQELLRYVLYRFFVY